MRTCLTFLPIRNTAGQHRPGLVHFRIMERACVVSYGWNPAFLSVRGGNLHLPTVPGKIDERSTPTAIQILLR
jgi:hypothetical protein